LKCVKKTRFSARVISYSRLASLFHSRIENIPKNGTNVVYAAFEKQQAKIFDTCRTSASRILGPKRLRVGVNKNIFFSSN
jgi:hypothetical protein